MVNVVSGSSDCALLKGVCGVLRVKVSCFVVCFSKRGQEIFLYFFVTRRDFGFKYETKSKAEIAW
jgi:hypothetical protein